MDHPLQSLVPDIAAVTSTEPVGGGCISDAQRVRFRDARGQAGELFVKSNQAAFSDNFQCEWDGLTRLAEVGQIGVPQPRAVGVVKDRAYLVTDWIEPEAPGPGFFDRFGTALAQLHRATLGSRIGLDRDNYLGAARQINTVCPCWVEFVADHRIGFQLRWAVDQDLAGGGLRRDLEQIIRSMQTLLAGRDDETSLLHGDLWSGNYLCGPDGQPFVVDPAVYYGCREAEFGMLRLYGSCQDSFYRAYQDAFPLPEGWQRRVNVYVLYHLLNHLNLFGSGYLSQCRAITAELLRG